MIAALLLAAVAAGQPAPSPRPTPPAAVPLAVSATPVEPAVAAPGVRVTGALSLSASHAGFGGLSGLLAAPDGGAVMLLSDRGMIFEGPLRREAGRLVGVGPLTPRALRGPDGARRPLGRDDAEDMARAPNGDVLIAFEGDAPRIWRDDGAGRVVPLPLDAGFPRLQSNSGLEALAVAPDGAVLAIPERSGAETRPFPVLRLAPGATRWQAGSWPRTPPYLVTGADVGPDGALYVVERAFSWLGGFSWRLLRADLADWPDLRPEALVTVRGGVDNVEGVAAWRDGDGRIRLLLVADDNFNALQRTLLLELALDGPG